MTKKLLSFILPIILITALFIFNCTDTVNDKTESDGTDETPAPEKVSLPTFVPVQGYYLTVGSVSINCSTIGTTKYYTIDESVPTVSSLEYSSPISVMDSMTIKTRAYKDGWTESDIATAYYNIATKRDMVSVTGGTYTQTNGTESFSHTISSFSIGKYEVTYELWYTIYNWAISNGYNFENQGMEGHNGTIGAEPTSAKFEPVTTISWRDAIV
ncbi:MAG: chitobiase/beta-hexosaminidase C-terminal domain-containing protein [Spirochaetes bacterium]|nr:chitobiase/beta-hexosaminidase C-terminal domain-containing protein [Spirochaetota bacterium]